MKTKEIRDVFFKYLEDEGYKTTILPQEKTKYSWYDEEYDEEFPERKYKVTNFRIKGCKKWLFGLWIHPTETNKDWYEIEFFAEHDHNMDKFKPSATFLCERYVVKSDISGYDVFGPSGYCDMFWYYIKELISMTKNQPYIAFYMAVTFLKYPDYKLPYRWFYVKMRLKDLKWWLTKKWRDFYYDFKWKLSK